MYLKYAKLISLFILLGYGYVKSKNIIYKHAFMYIIFFSFMTITFKILFPDINFGSETWQYLSYLAIVGIPFLVIFVKIFNEIERQKSEGVSQEKIIVKILTLDRSNIIFWVIISLIIALGLMLDKCL